MPASNEPAKHVDIHGETVRAPDVEMPGELTSHADPLSGESGMHPVGVGVGAAAGGVAAGTVAGLTIGAFAGPLGAAIGAALGTTIGAFGGGYTGKRLAEKINPTTEDHYWRYTFATHEYIPKGAKYEQWEPAYEYGIDMREWLIDKTWEESETMIRTGWEQSQAGQKLSWEKARPAIMDAWDHLTPDDPDEPEVTQEGNRED